MQLFRDLIWQKTGFALFPSHGACAFMEQLEMHLAERMVLGDATLIGTEAAVHYWL